MEPTDLPGSLKVSIQTIESRKMYQRVKDTPIRPEDSYLQSSINLYRRQKVLLPRLQQFRRMSVVGLFLCSSEGDTK